MPMANNAATWTFTWTAPSTDTSAVVFSYAGNAVNGNFATTYDSWNRDTSMLLPAGAAKPSFVSMPIVSNISAATAEISVQAKANLLSSQAVLEYGIGAPSTSVSMQGSPFFGTSTQSLVTSLSGLQANTTYTCKITLSNAAGDTSSQDFSFTTSPLSIVEQNKLNKLYINKIGNNEWFVYNTPHASDFALTDMLGRKQQCTFKQDAQGVKIHCENSIGPLIFTVIHRGNQARQSLILQ
jgi:hypothetical protein